MANTNTTLPSVYKSPLAFVESQNGEYNVKFTVPYTQVAQAAASGATDTVTVILGTTPTLWAVPNARVNITTAFAGTGGLAVTVGTTATVTAFIASASVLNIGSLGQQGVLTSLTNATGTTATTLVAVFTNSVSGSPSALTGGSADIYLNLQNTIAGNQG